MGGHSVVGREPEIAAVGSALSGDMPCAVVLSGVAGIGKSMLWETALDDAASRGFLILRARGAEVETRLALSGVGDLLDGAHDLVLPRLPGPQRRALESALFVSDESVTSELAVRVAFLSALRVLCADRPVVLAVDDVQWLDPASAEVIDFATRRLRAEQVLLFVTHRSDRSKPDEGTGVIHGSPALDRQMRVEVGPLSFGAIRRLLATRSTLNPHLRLARQIHDASGGNPLLALELAAAMIESGSPVAGSQDPLPVPHTLDELLSSRLAALSAGGQRAVLATAITANPTAELVRTTIDSAAGLEEAIAAGLAVADEGGLRLAHPLVGSAARQRAEPVEIASLHRRLAGLVADPEDRVRHLAVSAEPPDAEVADELEAVSAQAARRGAPLAAAELAEQGWRFTPQQDPRRDQRLLRAVELFQRAGEDARGLDLLTPEFESLLTGSESGRARLTRFSLERLNVSGHSLDEVLVDADPQLRSEVLLEKADAAGFNADHNIADACEWAREAYELAHELGDQELQVRCLTSLTWSEALLGVDPEPTLLRAALDTAPTVALWLVDDPDRVRLVHAIWRGEVAIARTLLTTLIGRAGEQADEWSIVVFTLHLFELAIRVGDWHEVSGVHSELAVLAAPFPAGPTSSEGARRSGRRSAVTVASRTR